jgi:hypothetical protein
MTRFSSKERLHHIQRKKRTSSIARFQRNRQPKAGPTLGHQIHLTSPTLDFLFRVYIKDAVYMPPLSATLPELAGRVRDAVATASLDLHNNVCTETGYRHDICRTTHGALTEYQLNGSQINVIKLSNQVRLIFFL